MEERERLPCRRRLDGGSSRFPRIRRAPKIHSRRIKLANYWHQSSWILLLVLMPSATTVLVFAQDEPTVAPTNLALVTSIPTLYPTFGAITNPNDTATTNQPTSQLIPPNSTTMPSSLSPTLTPSATPTATPTATHSSTPTTLAPTPLPSESVAPSFTPSNIPSGMPSRSSSPSTVPTVTSAPTSSRSPSSAPSSAPTLTLVPTSSPTLSPSYLPTQQPSSTPSHAPSQSPTITLINVTQEIIMILNGMTNGLVSTNTLPVTDDTDDTDDDNNNSTVAPGQNHSIMTMVQAWEELTSNYVRQFWQEFYLSPYFVTYVDTVFVNETRLEGQTFKLRQRWLTGHNADDLHNNNNNSATENMTNETDDGSTPTDLDQDNETDTVVLPLQIRYRQEIVYGVLRTGDDFDLGDPGRVLFTEPFEGSPFPYTNELGILIQSNQIVRLVRIQPFHITPEPTTPPTNVPSLVPTRVPTRIPTVPPPPPSPPTREIEEQNQRRIVITVVVVVTVSVCVAAGYLYYLVAKENEQALFLDGLPEDMEGRNYYVDTRQDPPPGNSPPPYPHRSNNSDNSQLVRMEENQPLNALPTPAYRRLESSGSNSNRGSSAGGGAPTAVMAPVLTSSLSPMTDITALTNATSTTASGTAFASPSSTSNTTRNGTPIEPLPPPMAVLDDALASEDDEDPIGLLTGINNPSFDSADGSTMDTPFDLTGFQMDVQNLDDI